MHLASNRGWRRGIESASCHVQSVFFIFLVLFVLTQRTFTGLVKLYMLADPAMEY